MVAASADISLPRSGPLREIARLSRYAVRRLLKPDSVNIANLRLRIPEGARGAVLRSLYAEKYEQLECSLLPALLRADDRVLEIGSAIGLVGLVCARSVGLDRLEMVEANQDLRGEIIENFRANGFGPPWLHMGLAACRDGDPVPFRVSSQFWSSSTHDRGSTKRIDMVEQVNINRLIEEQKTTVLICDIEGGEVDLLPCLDLSAVRLIVAELHERVVGKAAVDQVANSLVNKGFMLRAILNDEVYVLERSR